MFERYTEPARRAIFFARYEASQVGSRTIETEHLLLGLLREDPFLRAQIDAAKIRQSIEAKASLKAKISTSLDLPLNHEAKRVLAYGAEESERLRHPLIGCLHLALGLFRESGSFAAQLLQEQELKKETIVARLKSDLNLDLPALPSIGPLAKHLAAVVAFARPRLQAITETEALNQAVSDSMGHLLELATAHHQLFIRASVEPRVDSLTLPALEYVSAQRYDLLPWEQLVELWLNLQQLLIHILSQVPPEKFNTPYSIGNSPAIPLSQLADEYAQKVEMLISEILAS